MTLRGKLRFLPPLLVLAALFSVLSFAESTSGEWGAGSSPAAWTLDDDGLLTVAGGKGKTQNYASESPWNGYAARIRAVEFHAVTFPDNCQYLFKNLSAVQTVSFADGCDMTAVSSVAGMFDGCQALTGITGLSGFANGKSSNFTRMFAGCESLRSLDFSAFLTTGKKELDLSSLFDGCAALRQVPLCPDGGAVPGCTASGSVRNITLNRTFAGCKSLRAVDLRFSFSPDSAATPVSGMKEMFSGCEALETADLSTYRPVYDTTAGRYADLSGLFDGCAALSKVTLGSRMPAVSLPSVEINGHADWYSAVAGQWFTSAQIRSGRKFTFDVYAKDAAQATFPPGTVLTGNWGDCVWTLETDSGALSIQNDALKAGAPVASGVSPWAAYASLIRSVSFARVQLPMQSSGLFRGLSNLTAATFSQCETSGATVYYQYLFADCTSLQALDLTGFPVHNVVNVTGLFSGCTSLRTLTLPDFESTLTVYTNALTDCVSLESLSCGLYFTVRGTGLPMADGAGRRDWYDGAAGRWYASADEFPERDGTDGARRTFIKNGPTTDLSGAEIRLIPGETLSWTDGEYAAVYSGAAIAPGVSVLLNGRALDAGLYSVSFENNIHVGHAALIVSGNGERHYSGRAVLENAFAIRPYPLAADSFSLEGESAVITYTGAEIRPGVSARFGDSTLRPAGWNAEDPDAGDFVLTWQNNVNVPETGAPEALLPCAVVSGLAGADFLVEREIVLPFSIAPMPLSGEDVRFTEMEEVYFNGEPRIPSFVLRSVKPIPEGGSEGRVFRAFDGTAGDYTVSCGNNTAIGTDARLTVTFRGNFTGTAETSFPILAARLEDVSALVPETPVYTGMEQRPALSLTAAIGGGPYALEAGRDYEIAGWANNRDAWQTGQDADRQPAVTLEGKGIFGGTRTVRFEIRPRDLKDAVVALTDSWLVRDGETLSVVYDGEAHLPAPEVTFAFPAEEEGGAPRVLSVPQEALLVSCLQRNGAGEETEDAVNAGTVRVRVAAKAGGNFTGAADARPEFRILPARLTAEMIRFAGRDGALIPPAEYAPVFTGGEILPAIRIVFGEKTIDPGSPADPRFCSVSGVNNVNAHDAEGENAPAVLIEGTGNFTTAAEPGDVFSVPFAILPCQIGETGIGIGAIADCVYNGQAQRPAIRLSGEFLCPGGGEYVFRESGADGEHDYTANYENCTGAADADGENPPAVTLSFHGNFSGTLTKTFTIRPLPLTDPSVKVSAVFPETPPVYTGSPQEPVPALALSLNEEALSFEQGTDYALSWENNTDAWQAGYEGERPAALAAGKGNYTGVCRLPFSIAPRSIGDAAVRLADAWLAPDPKTGTPSVAYNGKPRVPAPVVTLSVPAEGSEEGFTLTVPPEALKVDCLREDETEDAVSEGTVYVRVTAKDRGNFTGEAKARPVFRIFMLSLSECEVRLAIPVPAFLETGRPKRPAVVAEEADVGILREGTDFAVSYADNVKRGIATVTLTSLTEEGVTKEVTFPILPAGERKAALPASLRALESHALSGASFREIELPASCLRIGANAFAPDGKQGEPRLLQITIPNAEAEVDEKAFGGLSAFTLCAPEGLMIGAGDAAVPVEAFCASHGIYYEQIPD